MNTHPAVITSHDSAPGFSYTRLAPRGTGATFVESYWEVRASRCRAAVEAAFPDTSVEIYFNLGSGGRQIVDERFAGQPGPRAAWVAGPRARTTLIAKETQDCEIVGVRLRPGAARRVLGLPISELGGGLVDLDLLWGSAVSEIRERLAAATDTVIRMGIVETALLRRGAATDHETPLVEAMCAGIGAPELGSIGRLAERLGVSHRRLIALFDAHVGHKPKRYHRLHRLRQVLAAAANLPVPWARIAARFGFADQAHLVHEFRDLTGFTPTHYAARRMRAGDGYLPHRLATPALPAGTGPARVPPPGQPPPAGDRAARPPTRGAGIRRPESPFSDPEATFRTGGRVDP